MKYAIILCLALFVISCHSKTSTQPTTDTNAVNRLRKVTGASQANGAPVITSLCFLRTEGGTKRDSTSVELVVNGNKITGLMNWLPYQKDSRKGTLTGTVKNDTITATWAFVQEGMKDTLNLKFFLKNDSLSQKPLKLNAKTGREQTDGSAGYSLRFTSSAQVHK